MDNLTKELEFEVAEKEAEAHGKPIILLGADHAGFKMKEEVKEWLRAEGYKIEDQGAFSYDETDDYPAVCHMVAKQVGSDDYKYRGLLFGGSGQGEAMTANRHTNARTAVYYGGGKEILKLSREHNDANILSIGARFVENEDIKEMIRLWLDTPFSGEERHVRRIAKIDGKLKEENIF